MEALQDSSAALRRSCINNQLASLPPAAASSPGTSVCLYRICRQHNTVPVYSPTGLFLRDGANPGHRFNDQVNDPRHGQPGLVE